MRVLVTGGAGFIGSWVVETLLNRGYEVAVLDNFSTGRKGNIDHLLDDKRVSLYEGDIRDSSLVDQAASESNSTIHLAALASVESCTQNPKFAIANNVEGTATVLEAAKWNSHKRFVYASSVAVYGEPVALPVREEMRIIPKNVYGATKVAAEALVSAYQQTFGISCLSLRLFNVYGPRQGTGEYSGVIARFITDALKGNKLSLEGSGRQSRDFIFVKDVADAFVLSLRSKASGVINIGTGKEVSIIQLASLIKKIAKKKIEYEHKPKRQGDIYRSKASIELAMSKLRWRPKTSIEKGLRETFRWYKDMMNYNDQ
ncbi:MAG: GDP-mannose 4,6-dehydratase [Nitrososphaerota archaeon]